MKTLLFVVTLLIVGGVEPAAVLAQPYRYDHEPGERLFHDLSPQPWPRLLSAQPKGEARLALKLELVRRPRHVAYGGGLMVTIPTRLLAAPRKAKRPSQPHDGLGAALAQGDAQPTSATNQSPQPLRTVIPRVRTKDAQQAVAAALRHGGAGLSRARLESMASRARWSALLPRVRLRATRLIDESSSLSPTSYDAHRTTSSGGASLWLEARTSWSLDRLVFADEEPRIERLRNEQQRWRQRLSGEILTLLFDWQRAVHNMLSPLSGQTTCMQSWLREQQLAATLTIATGGWFRRWRQRRIAGLGIEQPDCNGRADELALAQSSRLEVASKE